MKRFSKQQLMVDLLKLETDNGIFTKEGEAICEMCASQNPALVDWLD